MTSREGAPTGDWQDFESADTFPRPFGTYILLQAFARGGMGEVYLAKSGGIAGLEKNCVLKKLRPELTSDREYVQRFIDEAKVVVQLNHANIAQVFDVGRVGPEYYLAMEYVSGRDLRTVQDKARDLDVPIPLGTILHLVCEVLEALDYAHRRTHPLTGEDLRLVHRDVSPQNVLLSFEGEVKLIDFGLAQSNMKAERTSPNIVMGKMAYMAPEQARGDPIDHRADLFAAGVMLYEFVANERFYEGKGAHEIWQVVGRGGYLPPKWDAIDPELRAVLGKAMAADREQRFATCGEFEAALTELLHTHYGGKPARSTLRLLVEELFGDEVSSEREMLARLGRVTMKPEEVEASRSQSVSLLDGDDNEAGVYIARDEGPLDEWGVPVSAETMIGPTTDVGVEALPPQGLSREHPRVTEDPPSSTPPTGVQRFDGEVPITVAEDEGPRGRGAFLAAGAFVIIGLLAVVGLLLMNKKDPLPPLDTPPSIDVTVPIDDPIEPVEVPTDVRLLRLEEGRRVLGGKGYPQRPSVWPANVRGAYEAAQEGPEDERDMYSQRFIDLAARAPDYVKPRVNRPVRTPVRTPRASQTEMVRAVASCAKPCKKEVLELKLSVDGDRRLRGLFKRKLSQCYAQCTK